MSKFRQESLFDLPELYDLEISTLIKLTPCLFITGMLPLYFNKKWHPLLKECLSTTIHIFRLQIKKILLCLFNSSIKPIFYFKTIIWGS